MGKYGISNFVKVALYTRLYGVIKTKNRDHVCAVARLNRRKGQRGGV